MHHAWMWWRNYFFVVNKLFYFICLVQYHTFSIRLLVRVQINILWSEKHCDLENTVYIVKIFQFLRCRFSHLDKKSWYQSIIQFLIAKQRNKTYSAVVKNNFNIHVIFYENSFIAATCMLKLWVINSIYLRKQGER